MSMISSQCDELRETADELDERAKAYVPTGRNVLSPMLRTAADTIWELRCKLAGVVDQSDEIERLKAENAKLREERDHWRVEQVHAYGNWEDTYKRASELEAENVKLRELARDMWCNGMCECDESGACAECEYHFPDRMRELGVEI